MINYIRSSVQNEIDEIKFSVAQVKSGLVQIKFEIQFHVKLRKLYNPFVWQ